MIQKILKLKIDFDYKKYTNENLSKFNDEYNKLKN